MVITLALVVMAGWRSYGTKLSPYFVTAWEMKLTSIRYFFIWLQWRHNGPNGVSNHQPHDCLLNRLFWRRSKKTSKLRVTGLWWPVNSPHKRQVTRKMFPFDDVIMSSGIQSVLFGEKEMNQQMPRPSFPWSMLPSYQQEKWYYTHAW